MNKINKWLHRSGVLYRVRKPSRYIGNEWNSVIKNSRKVTLRFVLVFPDLYEIGISNLGLRILYDILNDQNEVLAERAYIPWKDMIEEMKKADIPLFSLETKTPLTDFDVLGFSLQYELSYTNVLLALELAKMPLFSEKRLKEEKLPIVIAGGPCTTNPLPMEDFIDAFVIGDGEEVIKEIVEVLIANKNANKLQKLEMLSEIEGVYVPILRLNKKVTKRVVDLNEYDINPKQIVPYIDAIHNRGIIEVMRGCTRGCRFCHAGMIYRPVRERNPKKLADAIKRLIEETGYEEISLLSLSTSDYTGIDEVLEMILPELEKNKIAISIPSTRMDAFNVELANKISKIRKTGLTFAPEAGSQKMRDIINKGINTDNIFKTLKKAKDSGWKRVKLYFMIGLPGEEDEDLVEIVNLIKNIKSQLRFREINVSVATFVPKPHTPFQFAEQITPEESLRKFKILKEAKRYARIFLHDPYKSFVEGIISRGDRKIFRLVYKAYKDGAIFDDWDENFDFKKWEDSMEELKLNPKDYIRERDYNEELPWDFVDVGIDKRFLIEEYERSKNSKITKDCRWYGCANCGVCMKLNMPNIIMENTLR